MAWISPTTTSSDAGRSMAGNVPPNGAFELQVTVNRTVAVIGNVPPGRPEDERR
jgi:hypothetical protein